MIHYFNPGHETAVLNRSKYFHPAANQVKMQHDLALLPAWYADHLDYILLKDDQLIRAKDYIDLQLANQPIGQCLFSLAEAEGIQGQPVDLWGISPHAVHVFDKLSDRYGLDLGIAPWKEEYHDLSSRSSARDCLSRLIGSVPEIDAELMPRCFSEIEEIGDYVESASTVQVLKTPFSSSGRGLLWLQPGKLNQSEQQIISGMLRRQKQVSIERALDKRLDFSMHFGINRKQEVGFLGYSVFRTNGKGAYEMSVLASQNSLREQITQHIPLELIEKAKESIRVFLRERYAPHYTGCIGIDMLIYESGGKAKLNPCVEINMRKSMGYLALRLFEKHIHPGSEGEFRVDYSKDPRRFYNDNTRALQNHPLIIADGRIVSGYLTLCPVSNETNYRAYIRIKPSTNITV